MKSGIASTTRDDVITLFLLDNMKGNGMRRLRRGTGTSMKAFNAKCLTWEGNLGTTIRVKMLTVSLGQTRKMLTSQTVGTRSFAELLRFVQKQDHARVPFGASIIWLCPSGQRGNAINGS